MASHSAAKKKLDFFSMLGALPFHINVAKADVFISEVSSSQLYKLLATLLLGNLHLALTFYILLAFDGFSFSEILDRAWTKFSFHPFDFCCPWICIMSIDVGTFVVFAMWICKREGLQSVLKDMSASAGKASKVRS